MGLPALVGVRERERGCMEMCGGVGGVCESVCVWRGEGGEGCMVFGEIICRSSNV